MLVSWFQMYLWEPFLWLASKIPPIAPFIIRNSLLHGRIFYPEYTQVGKSFEIITAPLYVPLNAQVMMYVHTSSPSPPPPPPPLLGLIHGLAQSLIYHLHLRLINAFLMT